MQIGVTLPNGIPDIPGDLLLEWGVRAEALGFSTLGAISRIAYPGQEELITLAAVGGATSRIRLMPTVMVAPVREPVLLAKQAASLNHLTNGRLVLGMGTGMRDDDFTITGAPFAGRGKRLDAMLETMHRVWDGEALLEGAREVAATGSRVPIVFGANLAVPRVIERIARWGDGFIAAGSPQMVAPIIDGVRERWTQIGRDGAPRLYAASYFTLGSEDEAERNIRDYYTFLPAFGEMGVAAMVRNADAARSYVRHFEDAGFDEFLFSAASTDPQQLERLAEAVL